MTGSKCLLDTSIIIHAFKNDSIIVAQLNSIEDIIVPVTVIGELYYGAYKSDNPVKHISQVQAFLLNCKMVSCDPTTACIYGSVKSNLIRKGKPIPENDIWIAAFAIQYNLPLFTTDKHFEEIDNLNFFK
ncbi:tRNA(fMet)-specific endonuclease VapC [Chitinophaga niastensis]|uniref:tRNA(fMet)-specific endonuclease VapC n=1 Tax=Chitinophaga niastensis TaxID=536980 RepID=A0A2P8HNK9_CHINA|nr:type II toxin-antitoxin system VapC family toxin [Chitinophaga niastensis]PSL47809.1 tRNA(fMet)-specific endonuclease VapC [Chitinophaga niastensis]